MDVLAEYSSVISWKTAAACRFALRLTGDSYLRRTSVIATCDTCTGRVLKSIVEERRFYIVFAEIGRSVCRLSLKLPRPFTRQGRTDIKCHSQRSWAGLNSHRTIQSQTLHCFIVNVWLRIQEMDWSVSSIPAQARSDMLSWPFTLRHSTVTIANLPAEKRMHVIHDQCCSSPF